ncbi:unnamed protein product [Pleuronectes platessa]|uniref:Uncharacterized protein n=1 Tax=Pleuronectes platessa TaxID=8262 RepID=A0A9N7UVA1_PLEPL|nr:unnamed protein product [Pleuronectes platessa]
MNSTTPSHLDSGPTRSLLGCYLPSTAPLLGCLGMSGSFSRARRRGLSIVSDPNLHSHRVTDNSVSVVTQLQSLFSSPLWCRRRKGREQKRWSSNSLRLDQDGGCFLIDRGP